MCKFKPKQTTTCLSTKIEFSIYNSKKRFACIANLWRY